jgi:hypothetical protein
VPDYTPPYIIGRQITLTASGPVFGGDILAISGSGTVATVVPSATPSARVVGVAAQDVPTNGRVSLYGFGPVHESLADGVITAGDQVTTAVTAGRQVRTLPVSAVDVGAAFNQASDNTAINLAVSNTRSIIGVAITTAADGQKVRWMQTLA